MNILFDKNKCTACGACSIACMDQNDIDIRNGQKPYRRVFLTESNGRREYFSVSCRHCSDPACVNACPLNCISKDAETGFVIYDNSACAGCGKCEKACPFDAISMRPLSAGSRKMEKCDGCRVRILSGLLPACVKNCPMGALILEK